MSEVQVLLPSAAPLNTGSRKQEHKILSHVFFKFGFSDLLSVISRDFWERDGQRPELSSASLDEDDNIIFESPSKGTSLCGFTALVCPKSRHILCAEKCKGQGA